MVKAAPKAKLSVKKPAKQVEEIDILQDDEFDVTPEQQNTTTTPIQNVLDSILKTQVSNPSKPILSHFKKPMQKLKQQKTRIKQERKVKQQHTQKQDRLRQENDGYRFIDNKNLEKELKQATMKGVIKIMNIISTYRKENPDQIN